MQVGELDLEACLKTVHAVGEASVGLAGFMNGGVTWLPRLAASDLPAEISKREIETFLYRMARALDDARAAWGVPSVLKPAAPARSLTAREEEVLQWLGSGKTDKDIGDILGISPRTVHKHLQRIYEKLGVENRTAAVVRAHRL